MLTQAPPSSGAFFCMAGRHSGEMQTTYLKRGANARPASIQFRSRLLPTHALAHRLHQYRGAHRFGQVTIDAQGQAATNVAG